MTCNHQCDECNDTCARSADHPGDHLCNGHAPQ
jgi:hypothetical protein